MNAGMMPAVGVSGEGPCGRPGDERLCHKPERLGAQTVVGPPSALLALDETSVREDPKVVADGWLRHPDRGG